MTSHAASPPMTSSYRRYLPLAALAAGMIAAWASGLHQYFSFSAIAEHSGALKDFVARHSVAALFAYAAVYIAVVALSLPGAAILSIFGGFLFGWAVSAPVTIVAATIGATIVFEVVKTSLGAVIAEKAGPFAAKLSNGFRDDAFNYLLFLRLVPAFPFFAVNAVAGLAGIARKSFVLATLIGIIPGSVAFAWLGRGFGSVVESQTAAVEACKAAGTGPCHFAFDIGSLVTKELLIAFACLGVVALIPVVLKRFRKAA